MVSKAHKAEKAEKTPAQTDKSIVEAGINRVVDSLGLDVQKAKYKAMRAIAWQAFIEYIDIDDFEDLVNRAIENSADLPTGWEVAKSVKKAPAKKTNKTEGSVEKSPAKKSPKKAPAKKEETDSDNGVMTLTEDDLYKDEDVQEAPKKAPRRRRRVRKN